MDSKLHLRDLVEGAVFKSLGESGGSLYRKTGKFDQFGSILCESAYNSSPFAVFSAPHWHLPGERVEVVSYKGIVE